MSPRQIRVLLVDDHASIRRGLRGLIDAKPRYTIVGEASNGMEALEIARDTNPDIVILDYWLSRQDGLALTRRLKEEFPRLEIVLFTLFDLESMVLEALEAGIRGMVLKSEREEHLLAAMDAVSLRRQYLSPALAEVCHYSGSGNGHGTSGLTKREREVVQLIAEGHIQKRIGQQLGISVKTVETHRTKALNKLGLSTTADLVRYAARNGLIVP